MGKKRNGGFSLVETLISIVILGAMVVPTCTALVMSIKLNDKTEQLLKAQLAVSSAVETLMAEGITQEGSGYSFDGEFPDVTITVNVEGTAAGTYYSITVSDKVPTGETPLVTVTTTIRAVEIAPEGGSVE